MKTIWNKLRSVLKHSDGMTMVEMLVAIGILAVFATGIAGTVAASNAVSDKADMISHFDRQNQTAVSEFKTNPDLAYLKGAEPFKDMDYSEDSNSFSKHYDKSFNPTNDNHAPYFVNYQYVVKPKIPDGQGFTENGEDVVLKIVNQKRNASGGYDDLQTSSAQGTGQIHAFNVSKLSIHPSQPAPTEPEASYSRVSFIVAGGIFTDEERNKRTVSVGNGTPLKDILPKQGELKADSGFTKFDAWKMTGTTETIPSDTSMTVTKDMSITGAFMGVPCTVNFKIPYYAGGWSANPDGETASYVSQNGETLDGDALAKLFGRNSHSELFTGGAAFKGWFDDRGNLLKLGVGGTVLTDGWNAKTVTAKVVVPSVTVKMKVTEGEGAGLYTLSIPVGGTISESEIAAAAGKDYSKIQNAGTKTLRGWQRQDNGTEFVPGSTSLTTDWNNSVIVSQYQAAVIPNVAMDFTARLNDRPYWDITNSSYDFVQNGSRLNLRVQENTTKANTPPYASGYKYYDLGDVNTLKSQLTDLNGNLKINLNIGYKYHSVEKFLNQNTDRNLYFNGKSDQSMKDKFNGAGASFTMGSTAAAGLKRILGFTGNVEVKPVLASREEPAPPVAPKILQRESIGAFLELGAASQRGRKDKERYELRIRKSTTKRAMKDGTPLYELGLIGENGDNILDAGKKMNPLLLKGETVSLNEFAGNDGLVLGNFGDKRDIKAIHKMSFVIRNRSRAGQGFKLFLKTDGNNEKYENSPEWTDPDYPHIGGTREYYKKCTFHNVKMAPGSDVTVNEVTVYVPYEAFDNLKPVGSGGKGGWLEPDVSLAEWDGGTASNGQWLDGYNRAGAKNLTDSTLALKDASPLQFPLPDNFEIK